jgi:hypothetical protein
MHARNHGSIDTNLATYLEANFAWAPPLASQSRADDMLEGPEGLTEDEVAAAFDEIERHIAESPGSAIDTKLGRYEILAGRIYDFAELEQVDNLFL